MYEGTNVHCEKCAVFQVKTFLQCLLYFSEVSVSPKSWKIWAGFHFVFV